MTKIQDELLTAISELGLGTQRGGNSDLVEILSTPIVIIAQAVDGVAKAKEIGADFQD